MYEYICISTPLETPEKNCKLTTVSCTEDMPPENQGYPLWPFAVILGAVILAAISLIFAVLDRRK